MVYSVLLFKSFSFSLNLQDVSILHLGHKCEQIYQEYKEIAEVAELEQGTEDEQEDGGGQVDNLFDFKRVFIGQEVRTYCEASLAEHKDEHASGYHEALLLPKVLLNSPHIPVVKYLILGIVLMG